MTSMATLAAATTALLTLAACTSPAVPAAGTGGHSSSAEATVQTGADVPDLVANPHAPATVPATMDVSDVQTSVTGGDVEAVSLLGRPLLASDITAPLDAETLAERESLLAAAEADYDDDPRQLDHIIWYGRRLAYLGRYRDAIAVYTRGVMVTQTDRHRILRHRGHRWISLRQFDRAIADLSIAWAMARPMEDRIEADGLPNATGTPHSTTKGNITYHLGLAHFLKGDYERALAAYEECLELSRWNDDMLVATTHWTYMTLRRLGRDAEAAALLQDIGPDTEVVENMAYRDLALLRKGLLQPGDVLAEGDDGIQNATAAFGVANWYLVEGQPERARAIMQRIVEGSAWPAFGFLAAEADLARGIPGE